MVRPKSFFKNSFFIFLASFILVVSGDQPVQGREPRCFDLETSWNLTFDQVKELQGEPTHEVHLPEDGPPSYQAILYKGEWFGVGYDKYYIFQDKEFTQLFYEFHAGDTSKIQVIFDKLGEAIGCNFSDTTDAIEQKKSNGEVRALFRNWQNKETYFSLMKINSLSSITFSILKKTPINELEIQGLKKIFE